MKKRFVSLASRNALVYFFLFVIGLALSSYLFFSYSSKEILDLTKKRLIHSEEMIQLKFETYIDQLERDINQLSYSPILENYINNPDSANRKLLTQEYISFLKTKSNYFQIRLINAQEGGMEVIRVERKQENLLVCPVDELQFKGTRDYYKEINQLPNDSLYLSKIDLNREYDQIMTPRVPTVRIGKRTSGNELKDIMLVVNVDLRGLFNELNNLTPQAYELRVFNHGGHYLIHPDEAATFTFDYGNAALYASEYEIKLREIGASGTSSADDIATNRFFQLSYPRSNYQLYGVVSAKNADVFASFYQWRSKVVMVSVGSAVLFLIMAFIYMRRQARELKNITQKLISFSGKMEPSTLAITRNDEIGELAKGFEQMSAEISESHAAVAKAKDEAEQANEEKNEFLENMSHEIRNPLQSILGITAILEQNKSATDQQPFIDSLKVSATQLKSLVTDVLDFGKIKKGQVELRKEWKELDVFCTDLINGLRYEASKKQIQVEFKLDPDLSRYLFKYDQVRLYQILNNLLNNAVKFTPQKGIICLAIKLKGDKINFTVIDTGVGIEKSSLSKIMNRNVGSDYTLGSGLGLTIVQELLFLHGAKLNVASEVGRGSTFRFELSFEKKLKERHELGENKDNLLDFEDVQVLVIEDDLELQHWYQHILKPLNPIIYSSVDAVTDTDPKFDLILTDLNFETSTFTVPQITARLKRRMKNNGRLMVISGGELPEPSTDSVYLQKPVQKKTLVKLIHEELSGQQHGQLNFTHLEHDYDHESQLILNALQVMIREWEKDRKILENAILNRDQEKLDAIKHRIITSVRRLEIHSFETFLDHINFADDTLDFDKIVTQLNAKMRYYIEKMKAYT